MAKKKKPLHTRGALISAGVLILLGGLAAWLLHPDELPVVATSDEVWELTATVDVEPRKLGSRLWLTAPRSTRRTRVIGVRLDHFGYRRANVKRSERDGIPLISVEAGPARISASWRLHHRPGGRWATPTADASVEQRAAALTRTPEIPHDAPEVRSTLGELVQGRPPLPEVARRIFAYCREQIHVEPEGREDVPGVLQERVASARGRARAMAALCRAAKLPARTASGVELAESDPVAPRVWVEVLLRDQWLSHDLDTGLVGQLPARIVPLAGTSISSEGRGRLELLPRAAPVSATRDPRQILDLSRLPSTSQESLILLLLLPLGALLSACVTTFLGARPFGTFTPTLLAATFLRTDIRVSAAVLGTVLLFGIGGRWLLGRLGLDRTHRLSVVFTLVALSMVFVASGLDYFGMSGAAGPALLPIVVLTMIVDRMTAVADELGLRAAIRRLCWTLVIAGACAPLLAWDWLGLQLLRAPHLHLFSGAAFLALGAYRGAKWLDRKALRWMLEPEKPKKKKKAELATDPSEADEA